MNGSERPGTLLLAFGLVLSFPLFWAYPPVWIASLVAAGVGLALIARGDDPRRWGALAALAALATLAILWIASQGYTLGRFGWIATAEAAADPGLGLLAAIVFAAPLAAAAVGAAARPRMTVPLVVVAVALATPAALQFLETPGTWEWSEPYRAGPVTIARGAGAGWGFLAAYALLTIAIVIPPRAGRAGAPEEH